MKITKEQAKFLENFLHETGFEIVNAECTHSLSFNSSLDGFTVCEYYNPKQPVKKFKTAQAAINYLQKEVE